MMFSSVLKPVSRLCIYHWLYFPQCLSVLWKNIQVKHINWMIFWCQWKQFWNWIKEHHPLDRVKQSELVNYAYLSVPIFYKYRLIQKGNVSKPADCLGSPCLPTNLVSTPPQGDQVFNKLWLWGSLKISQNIWEKMSGCVVYLILVTM